MSTWCHFGGTWGSLWAYFVYMKVALEPFWPVFKNPTRNLCVYLRYCSIGCIFYSETLRNIFLNEIIQRIVKEKEKNKRDDGDERNLDEFSFDVM